MSVALTRVAEIKSHWHGAQPVAALATQRFPEQAIWDLGGHTRRLAARSKTQTRRNHDRTPGILANHYQTHVLPFIIWPRTQSLLLSKWKFGWLDWVIKTPTWYFLVYYWSWCLHDRPVIDTAYDEKCKYSVFLALCQTKPRWSLIKISKLDEAFALNKGRWVSQSTQCLWSVVPLAMLLIKRYFSCSNAVASVSTMSRCCTGTFPGPAHSVE